MKKFILAAAIVALIALAAPAFAATNPFMDVPASHWAFDAVAQLAARGVISGYPEGSFKGSQPSTRYELASIVARALAKVDLDKASKEDVDLLKKLVVEFKDELDVLGVRVDGLDERVATLETDIGGWNITGELNFNAKFGQDNGKDWYADDADFDGENEFELADYVLWISKRIDENSRFAARLERGDGLETVWANYYVTTKLPWDISLSVGLQDIDWEGDLGLYIDNDAMIGDWTFSMFQFERDWGLANLKFLVGRVNDDAGFPGDLEEDSALEDFAGLEKFLIAGQANFTFSEKFRAGLLAYYFITDNEISLPDGKETDLGLGVFGAYAGYAFTPDIEGKALYYYQTQGDTLAEALSGYAANYDDSASAWKVILDIKQDALKFTSLWLEYGQIDNNFLTNERFGLYTDDNLGAIKYSGSGTNLLYNMPYNGNSSKVYGARLDQEWNDKWRTYLRYFAVNHDTDGIDDAANWSVGVGYRLNPAVEFELSYDAIDYGTGAQNERNGDDNIIRLSTYVTF
ncbi:MAG: S-layer homology domain-containing protein [Synergistaceae bacterium]|jgi:hypothetical protein|nr:S-layer homology domain-containing protein [Synergistaceae bacterium]